MDSQDKFLLAAIIIAVLSTGLMITGLYQLNELQNFQDAPVDTITGP